MMQLSTEAAYQALKYWLPIATGFVMVWKGYRHAVDSFTTWVEAMLNGHLRGIQSTNEEIVVLLGTIIKGQQDAARQGDNVRVNLAGGRNR